MIQDIKQDPRFASIGNLPSNFFPYKGEFKVLNIRPFTVAELKLLSRAAVTKNVVSTIKALDQTIDQPIERLSIGDFYYVMMWHKLHSFPKTPLSVQWECNATIPLDKDNAINRDIDGNVTADNADHFDLCKNPNAQLIHQSDIDIVDIEETFKGFDEANFDFPRVSILPELLELNTNPEYAYLLGAAQWIKTGNTLAQKFEYLESLPDIEQYEIAETLNKEIIHGVSETVRLKCSRCGSTFLKKLELDPVNFFRPCL